MIFKRGQERKEVEGRRWRKSG